MGFYREQILPRVIDKACGNAGLDAWRIRCMEGLSGTVVEPGFGSGSNVANYPNGVTKIYAIDPAVVGQKLAAKRLEATDVDVEFVGLDGQSIPLPDDSCDAGLLTFTLCSIPDAPTALAELRRVIKPGGALHFLEHGLAPTANIQKLQYRIDPVQKRLFDGCHVSRNHPLLLEQAGFVLDWSDAGYTHGPKPWAFLQVGRATNPAT